MRAFETYEPLSVAGALVGRLASVQRLIAMYQEMPGTRLSADEAARLAGLDVSVCLSILESLVEMRLLRRGCNGTFLRASDGASRVGARKRQPPLR
jgi:hypothetical protein